LTHTVIAAVMTVAVGFGVFFLLHTGTAQGDQPTTELSMPTMTSANSNSSPSGSTSAAGPSPRASTPGSPTLPSATPSASVSHVVAPAPAASRGRASAASVRVAERLGSGTVAPSPLRVGVAYSDVLPWTTSSRRDAALQDAVALHAGWIRIDLPWMHIQPESSTQWLWERYDPTVRAARAKGLDILFVVSHAPPWARDSSCRNAVNCPPASVSSYSTFIGAAAAHYAPMGVHAFEIWNEPNLSVFWQNPDPARFGSLVASAADAVHRSDPKGIAIIGGLAAAAPGSPVVDQIAFLSGVCATGACAKADGLGYHPYTFPVKASLRPSWATPWTRISVNSPSLRSVLAASGRADMPIWVTEFGAPTEGPGRESDGSPERADAPTDHVSESVQAALAADVIRTAAADQNIAAVFWYQQQDNPENGSSREAFFGLRRADGSAKPAFSAFSTAAANVGR
jgi:hypothetical protein